MANPSPRILLSPPDVGLSEREALLRAFDSNWISTAGPEIGAFEEEMSSLVRRPCVALSSGTAGLHLSLRLAGVSRGDVVLCQSFTFVATANPILYEGAIPCFVDSEWNTWNLCPEALETAITTLAAEGVHPKALMLVHLYGMPAQLPEILSLCERHGIDVIEDAAEALGSSWAGRPAGALGRTGVFSFNGNKIVNTAGGGMVTAENHGDASLLRKWSTQSREPVLHYEHTEIGYNYRLSNLLAALGRAQLARLPQMAARRRSIAARYQKELGTIDGISFQPETHGNYSNRWLTAMVVDPKVHPSGRDRVIQHLADHGIESRPLWKPMHRQPLFEGARYFGGNVAEQLFETGLCLPSGSALTEDQQAEVIGRVEEYLRGPSSESLARLGSALEVPEESALAGR